MSTKLKIVSKKSKITKINNIPHESIISGYLREIDNNTVPSTVLNLCFMFYFHQTTWTNIDKLMQQKVNELTTALEITDNISLLLLQKYKWNFGVIADKYLNDPIKTLKEAGNNVNENNNKSQQEQPNTRASKCEWCVEFKDKLFALECGHKIVCNNCWIYYLISNVNDEQCIFLKCPKDDCNVVIPKEVWKQLLYNQYQLDYQRYIRYLRQNYMKYSEEFTFCPNGCGMTFYDESDDKYNILCDKCKYEFCWQCKQETHYPLPCKMAMKWRNMVQKCSKCDHNQLFIKPLPLYDELDLNKTTEDNTDCIDAVKDHHELIDCEKCAHSQCCICSASKQNDEFESNIRNELRENPIWNYAQILNFDPNVLLQLPYLVRMEMIPSEFQDEVSTYLKLYDAQLNQTNIEDKALENNACVITKNNILLIKACNQYLKYKTKYDQVMRSNKYDDDVIQELLDIISLFIWLYPLDFMEKDNVKGLWIYHMSSYEKILKEGYQEAMDLIHTECELEFRECVERLSYRKRQFLEVMESVFDNFYPLYTRPPFVSYCKVVIDENE